MTISKLMRQTSTKHVYRYVEAANELKQVATDKIKIEL